MKIRQLANGAFGIIKMMEFVRFLFWKGNGKDQSQVSDIDEKGFELMNVTFEDVMKYCGDHKKDEVDKWHLDFSNAKWDKIKDLF